MLRDYQQTAHDAVVDNSSTGAAMKINKDDRAFPQKYEDQDGMTLRDYFAAKAMQGFLSNKAVVTRLDDAEEKNIAPYAYHVADMMINERAEEI